MILFLDFDGVLHPDDVYMSDIGPYLRGAGQLFMWAPILEKTLASHEDVDIVLSTSWVRNLGFSRAKKRLPSGLQQRVIGSTWHSSMAKVWADQIWWDRATRYGQISRYLSRSGVHDWIAIDDDDEEWAADQRHRLVHVNSEVGLSNADSLNELVAKLRSKYTC